MVPRELGSAARSGEVDVGLMASYDYFALRDEFELVEPNLGVAVKDRVRSVVLLAHEPPRGLHGKRIGVTVESSTSRRLIELLARGYWGIEVGWVLDTEIQGDPLDEVDALLLIGDRALEVIADDSRGGWLRVIDLATEWWAWQSLPFVFAVWAIRRAVPDRDREWFSGFLTGSLSVGTGRLAEIASAHAGPLGDARTLETYLGGFDYWLGQDERAGLARFGELLAEHDLLPRTTSAS